MSFTKLIDNCWTSSSCNSIISIFHASSNYKKFFEIPGNFHLKMLIKFQNSFVKCCQKAQIYVYVNYFVLIGIEKYNQNQLKNLRSLLFAMPVKSSHYTDREGTYWDFTCLRENVSVPKWKISMQTQEAFPSIGAEFLNTAVSSDQVPLTAYRSSVLYRSIFKIPFVLTTDPKRLYFTILTLRENKDFLSMTYGSKNRKLV